MIRAQERSQNLYASIDLVAGKLARQLQRHKDRRQGHGHHSDHQAEPEVMPLQGDMLQGRHAELPAPVVRRKYFAMPPMSVEEAIHQLEVIDHDFYVFRNAENGELQVVPAQPWRIRCDRSPQLMACLPRSTRPRSPISPH